MPSGEDPPPSAWEQLRDLEAKVYEHRLHRRVREQADAMEESIRFIEGHRDELDEPEDRIRVLRFRLAMLEYSRRPSDDSPSRKAHFLREAAAHSRPEPCDEAICLDHAPQCLERQEGFSKRRRKMCVERLTALTNALKLEASMKAARFDHAGALALRREALHLQRIVVRMNPSEGSEIHYRYLDYWCLVTEGKVALEDGSFEAARRAFRAALAAARHLPDGRCFPNYFFDLKDVRRHPIYVDALDWASRGRFLDAQREFQAWLDERPTEPYDLRTHTAPLLARLCGLLHAARSGSTEPGPWDALEADLRRAYTGPTIWALWRRARALRDAGPEEAADLLEDVAANWRLFNQDVRLTDDERGDRQRPVLPRFLDVAGKVRREQAWGEILRQTVRHALLFLAEYEARERGVPDPLEALDLPTPQIVDHLVALIGRNSPKARALRRTAQLLQGFEDAAARGEFDVALAAWQAALDPLAFFPHAVLVEGSFVGGGAGEGADQTWETTVERCWERAPHNLVLEGPEPLPVGRHYCMDSAWNLDHKPRARIRHEERLHPSQLVGPMDAFADGLFEGSRFERRSFHDWVMQFEPAERLWACRLASLLMVFDRNGMNRLWRKVIDQTPAARAEGTVFVGLGAHGGKSGPHQVYPFGQALKGVPDGWPPNPKMAFRALNDVDPARPPSAVVFLDDFIGTGSQAARTFKRLFEQHPWLASTRVSFGAAVGFADGAALVRAACPEVHVAIGKTLAESDRAFSPENPAWHSASERESARRFAQDIGELLVGHEMALGYQGSQALVAFPHNVPNNTLPLFWSKGSADRPWTPLLERS